MTAPLEPGRVAELAEGVRRLVAPNPGLMTGQGTNTYLVGRREIAVIDPGPAIEEHQRAVLENAGGSIRWILVTHTHSDHSPGAAMLREITGAATLGRPPPSGRHQDPSFRPERVLDDGERLSTPEFGLEAIHTPGHASNHLCYLHEGLNWLFTGDHIIDGSTVVIDPPDGDMAAYLDSLAKLKRRSVAAIAPGHGNVIGNPGEAIDRLVEHRLAREAKVVSVLALHPGSTLESLVAHVYDDVSRALHAIAARSLLAHLEKLEAESRARRDADRWRIANP
ncbi:MAG TPA: MBL fold metallo-hydrolase [Woeseiaceae bacterium]|nr:MBL fold metallo-hydrolase [Woeseiaceae bacterium]